MKTNVGMLWQRSCHAKFRHQETEFPSRRRQRGYPWATADNVDNNSANYHLAELNSYDNFHKLLQP